jgi:hypothetical protein
MTHRSEFGCGARWPSEWPILRPHSGGHVVGSPSSLLPEQMERMSTESELAPMPFVPDVTARGLNAESVPV